MNNSEQATGNKFRILQKLTILSLLLLISLPLTTKAVSTTFYPYPNGGSCSYVSSTDLSTDMAYQIDSRIQGLDGSGASVYKNLWTTRGNGTGGWVRNPSAWTSRGTTSLDLSGASPWNSNYGGSSYLQAGTLISPRHMVYANHYTYPIGTHVVFVDNSNNVVTRTVVDQMRISNNDFQDIEVALLDSDVPASIAYYPIIDINTLKRYWKSPIGSPVLALDQEDKALIFDFTNILDKITVASTSQMEWGYMNIGVPTNSTRASFNETAVIGDSGNPGFSVIGSKLALDFTFYSSTAAQFQPYWIDLINSAMTTLDGLHGVSSAYQASTIDLSCYTAQNTNPSTFASSSYSFSLPENSASSTVAGVVSLSSGTNQSFIISAGNTNNAFSTDAVSGNIYVASSSVLNFEVTPKFTLTINSKNAGWYWTNINGTTTAVVSLTNINETPYFTQTGFSFTFSEAANNGDSVGILNAADVDAGSVLSYSIDSGNNGLFAVSTSTGAITVANKTLINFDATSSYPLVVRVKDNGSPILYATTTAVVYVSPQLHPRIGFIGFATTTTDDVGTINIPFSLSTSYVKDINLVFSTSNGTAYASTDFSLATTTYRILSGQTTGSIPVNIVYKNALNYNKIFFVNIASADKALIGATSSEQITISNVINNTINEQLAIPSISSLTPTPSNTTASISWTSNVTASSTLYYGISTSYTSTSSDSATKSHTINLSNLSVCTTYHYQIISTGPAGLTSTSSDSAFTTTGCPVAAVSYGGGGGGGGGGYVPAASVPAVTIPIATSDSPATSLKPISTSLYKIGDRNKNVTNLQLLLVKAKLMDSSKVTGYFGQITKSALDLYNSKISKDISILNASSSVVSNIVATTSNVVNTTTTTFEFTKDLSLNMVNEDVRNLQIYLNNNGFPIASSGVGSPGHESNRFGPATKAALIKFQKANKIPATGLFGKMTRGVVNI